jgi:hypothetical protein
MATLNPPVNASVRSRAWAKMRRASVVPREDNLVSVRNTSLVPPDHVIRSGHPFIPKMLASSHAVLTADGTYVPELTYPYEAIFAGDEHTRFIAQDNMFDDIADKWYPLASAGVDYHFTWSGLVQPRVEQIDYRIGKLLYPMNSIRVEESASLVSSFNAGMDDASAFMIALAGVINSSERASLLRVGDNMGSSISIDVDEYFYIRNQYGVAKLETKEHPAAMVPFYLVLINDPSKTELNVSNGSNQISRATIPNQDSSRDLSVFIGEDLSGNKTLDINLFEITLFPYAYTGALSASEIIKAMADVYGSKS